MKKRSCSHLLTFPPSILQFSFFSSQFSPLFPSFLASFFPVGQQKFPGQKSLGALCPLPPPVCYATDFSIPDPDPDLNPNPNPNPNPTVNLTLTLNSNSVGIANLFRIRTGENCSKV